MAAGSLALTGPALAAMSSAPAGRLLLGVTRVPQGGQHVGSLGCHCSGWAGRGRGSSALNRGVLCPTRAEPSPWHSIPLPPSAPAGPLPASLARPAASRLPATSRGPVRLHSCPSTAIMARPQPLLPACPLPARPIVAAAACSVDRSPPAPESMGQGSAFPCAQGSAPQCGQGPPRTDPALRGCPGPPRVLPLGRAVRAAGQGSWAVPPVPALPRLCLHPACAGQSPASLQPQPPERPCPPTCLAPTW